MRRTVTALILALPVIISNPVALAANSEGGQTAAEIDKTISQASEKYHDVVAALRVRLRSIPTDSKDLSPGDIRALRAAEDYHDPDVAKELLRLITITKERKRQENFSPMVRAGPFPLDDCPAGRALAGHSLAGVYYILQDIEHAKGKIDDRRLKRYAEVIWMVLQTHTVAYLKEERSHAPKSAILLYDKLLATPLILGSRNGDAASIGKTGKAK